MSIKLKIALRITITLVIGIAIGVMLNRALVQKRIKNILLMRAAGFIAPSPERILKPTGPEQDQLIKEIFDKHGRRQADIHLRFSSEIQAEFKSLREELAPVLTPEQRRMFEKMLPGPPRFPNREPSGFRGGFRPPPLEMELADLKESLALSEEQAGEIQKILKEYRDQEESLMKKRMDPEGFFSQAELQEKKEKAIESVLTKDQKNLYRQLKKDRQKKMEEEMQRRNEGE